MKKILISACLCGVNCKYNGGNNFNKDIKTLYDEGKAILICPEALGGLKTPRTPREITFGTGIDVLEGRAKVLSKVGVDSTIAFIKGAKEALKIAKENNIKVAILKAKSPSCGNGYIYNGKFNGKLIEGNGVASELLIKNGIKVYNEKNYKGEF